jgi:hypothetical protein
MLTLARLESWLITPHQDKRKRDIQCSIFVKLQPGICVYEIKETRKGVIDEFKNSMTIFWNVDCSLTEGYKASSLMMEAVSTSETSTNFYQTKRRKIPEKHYLHTRLEGLAQRRMQEREEIVMKGLNE